MAKVKTNADELGDALDAIIEGFTFTSPGEQGSLAEDVVDVVASGIIDRSVPDAEDPEGNPWKANETKYAKYKKKKYDAIQPGVLSGQMLSLESLKGRPEVSPDSIRMVYGTDAPPSGTARNGAPLSDSETKLTDREKAKYFTEGGRSFYAMDDAIEADVVAKTSEAFDKYIDGAG